MPDSSKQTGSTESWLQPYMKDILGKAQTIFNSGSAWAPDTSSHVTPFSSQTQSALKGIEGAAGASQPAFDQNFNRVSATLNQGGLNSREQEAAGWLQKIASGGEMQNNPYLEQMIKSGSGDIANATNLMYSMGGRYGSGAHEGVLEKSLGDYAGGMRFADYNNQLARRDAAIKDYFGVGQEERANVMKGASDLSNAFNARLTPWQALGKTGQAYEAQSQKELDDKSRIFKETQNAQTAPLQWLADLIAKYQGAGTVTNTTSNPYANAAQGAMVGYDIFGGPIGASAGALAGYLG